jgi:hypothetical protein
MGYLSYCPNHKIGEKEETGKDTISPWGNMKAEIVSLMNYQSVILILKNVLLKNWMALLTKSDIVGE